MTNVKIDHPKTPVKNGKHDLKNGQYYVDVGTLANREIYIVTYNFNFDGYELVDLSSGDVYAGGGLGMDGDDADFILINDIEISYKV